MVSGNSRFAFFIKCVFVLIWIIYFFLFNSKYQVLLPSGKTADYELKKKYRKKCELVLLGGSNVSFGLSAKIISRNTQCVNLGLNSELGSFTKYSEWLRGRVIARFVVYSPAMIWSGFNDSISINKPLVSFEMPTSILSQIIFSYRLSTKSNSFFNTYGDAINNLHFLVNDYQVDTSNFRRANQKITREIFLRIQDLQRITKAENIYLRIPPIYNSSSFSKSLENLMYQRIKLLKSFGVRVLATTIVSSNKLFFQDNSHPSAFGRVFFTKELYDCLRLEKFEN